MFIGPIFTREIVTAPRRGRWFFYRAVYPIGLLVLMLTSWLVLAGVQEIQTVSDMARFGAILFRILAPLQLALVMFFAAITAASAVAQEKDRRTLVILLMTRLSNSELVLGKLFASLLNVLVMLAASLPIFTLIILFGGIAPAQIGRIFAVTLAAAFAAGSLGTLVAYWREKTFQTLALVALCLVAWLGLGEAVHAGLFGGHFSWIGGTVLSSEQLGVIVSPLRAVLHATSPQVNVALVGVDVWSDGVVGFVALSLAWGALMCSTAIALVRAWNPSRETFARQAGELAAGLQVETAESAIAGVASRDARDAGAERARRGHVDARNVASHAPGKHRTVWDAPILWREIRTWAYGRKMIFIRLVYLALFAAACFAVHQQLGAPSPATAANRLIGLVTGQPVVPLIILSLLMVNALAVTSITNERDAKTLDVLLVTDISPPEFMWGKLGGVFWITKEMVVLPMLLVGYIWWRGGVDLPGFAYMLLGLAVMNLFAAVLGMHCGINYVSSRTAVGVSLGIAFFLFMGVVTCVLMMISFRESIEGQILPFVVFIAGGIIGLFVTLGARNPSSAIAMSSLGIPVATFYAIVSFALGMSSLTIIAIVVPYSFLTAAMLVPALSEFDFAMSREDK